MRHVGFDCKQIYLKLVHRQIPLIMVLAIFSSPEIFLVYFIQVLLIQSKSLHQVSLITAGPLFTLSRFAVYCLCQPW